VKKKYRSAFPFSTSPFSRKRVEGRINFPSFDLCFSSPSLSQDLKSVQRSSSSPAKTLSPPSADKNTLNGSLFSIGTLAALHQHERWVERYGIDGDRCGDGQNGTTCLDEGDDDDRPDAWTVAQPCHDDGTQEKFPLCSAVGTSNDADFGGEASPSSGDSYFEDPVRTLVLMSPDRSAVEACQDGTSITLRDRRMRHMDVPYPRRLDGGSGSSGSDPGSPRLEDSRNDGNLMVSGPSKSTINDYDEVSVRIEEDRSSPANDHGYDDVPSFSVSLDESMVRRDEREGDRSSISISEPFSVSESMVMCGFDGKNHQSSSDDIDTPFSMSKSINRSEEKENQAFVVDITSPFSTSESVIVHHRNNSGDINEEHVYHLDEIINGDFDKEGNNYSTSFAHLDISIDVISVGSCESLDVKKGESIGG